MHFDVLIVLYDDDESSRLPKGQERMFILKDFVLIPPPIMKWFLNECSNDAI